MGFSLKEFIFGGTTFCCCFPVRFGVIAMALMSMFIAGALAIVSWFEVANDVVDLSTTEFRIFIIVGAVETLLLVVSILGLVGAIVRKQLFVTLYAYFVYAHFILNVIVVVICLLMLAHDEKTDVVKLCQNAIQDPQAKAQCTGLLNITEDIFISVAAFVLFIELYCAIIVTRYVNQLRSEKRTARMSRPGGPFNFLVKDVRYAPLGDGLGEYANGGEFDPYENYQTPYGAPKDSHELPTRKEWRPGSDGVGQIGNPVDARSSNHPLPSLPVPQQHSIDVV